MDPLALLVCGRLGLVVKSAPDLGSGESGAPLLGGPALGFGPMLRTNNSPPHKYS